MTGDFYKPQSKLDHPNDWMEEYLPGSEAARAKKRVEMLSVLREQMREVSTKLSIPLELLQNMQQTFNIYEQKIGNRLDSQFRLALYCIDKHGISFDFLSRALDILGVYKFSHLIDLGTWAGEAGLLKNATSQEQIVDIFKNTSPAACKNIEKIQFNMLITLENLYPYLVRCNPEHLDAFIAEIPRELGFCIDDPRMKDLIVKYNCDVGSRTKAAIHSEAKVIATTEAAEDVVEELVAEKDMPTDEVDVVTVDNVYDGLFD